MPDPEFDPHPAQPGAEMHDDLADEAALRDLVMTGLEALFHVVGELRNGRSLQVDVVAPVLGSGLTRSYRLGLTPATAGATIANPIPPGGMPLTPGERAILAAIQGLKDTMTETSDALADLAAANQELATEVGDLLTDVENFPAQQSAAIAAALKAAGVDDATTATAVEAAATSAKALAAQIAAVLAPPNPPTSVQISPVSIDGTQGTAISGSFSSNLSGNVTWSVENNPPDFALDPSGSYTYPAADVEAGTMEVTATSDNGDTGEASVEYAIAAASD